MTTSIIRTIYFSVLALTLLLSLPLTAKAAFIDPTHYNIEAIIPAPPQPGTEQYRIDTGYLKNARATANKEAVTKAHDLWNLMTSVEAEFRDRARHERGIEIEVFHDEWRWK